MTSVNPEISKSVQDNPDKKGLNMGRRYPYRGTASEGSYGFGSYGYGYGMVPPPYELPMDPLQSEGKYKEGFDRKPNFENLDVGTLSKEAKSVAESKQDAQKRMEAIVQKFIDSDNMDPREALHAMRELRSVGQETESAEREAGLYSAENERIMKLAEISAANFEDTFIARKMVPELDEETKQPLKDAEGNPVLKPKIDSAESKRRYDKFIMDAMAKGLKREQVLEAIELAAMGYISKERENAQFKQMDKHKEKWTRKGYPPELINDKDAVVFKSKNDAKKTVITEILQSGLPGELEEKFRKMRQKEEQRNFWLGIDDGWLRRAFGLDYLLNWEKFSVWAAKYKMYERDKVIQLMKDALTNYYWDPKGAFEWDPVQKKMVHPISSKEELLERITNAAGLPGEIKDHFRNEYLGTQRNRERFVDEFMQSKEMLELIKLSDNGMEKDRPINGTDGKPLKDKDGNIQFQKGAWTLLEERLKDLNKRGLIGGQEIKRIRENFENILDQGVRFENEMIDFGFAIMHTVRKMLDEHKEKGLDEGSGDLVEAISTDKVWARLEKDYGQEVFPRRKSLGGFEHAKYMERVIKAELDRDKKISDLQHQLEKLELDKPLEPLKFINKVDQGFRWAGNLIKSMLGGFGSPEESAKALNRNWFMMTKGVEADFEHSMHMYNTKRQEIKNQIEGLTDLWNPHNQMGWITAGYGVLRNKDSLNGLRGQIERGRLEAYRGIVPTGAAA